MELTRRLPFRRSGPDWPPFPDKSKASFPALADRFETADRVVLPAFSRQDRAALKAQNQYRRFRLVLITGAALTTVFGAVQAAVGGATWPGIVLAVLGLATAAIANQYRRVGPLATYLTTRAKAEELRSTYFFYLSGVGPANASDLETRVATIEYSEGNG